MSAAAQVSMDGPLARRRAASRRLPVGACGRADPWYYDEPPLTDHQLDGWRAAARHVLGAGVVPRVPVEALRALYRRGGPDRQLAERLHQLAGGVAA